jgi:hypothetical protein
VHTPNSGAAIASVWGTRRRSQTPRCWRSAGSASAMSPPEASDATTSMWISQSVGICVGTVAYSPDSVADFTLMLMLMAIRSAKSILRRTDTHDYRLDEVRAKELRDLTVGVAAVSIRTTASGGTTRSRTSRIRTPTSIFRLRRQPACGEAAGRCTVTQSPPPGLATRVRVPSCACVMLLTMARPSPTPAWSVRMRLVPR